MRPGPRVAVASASARATPSEDVDTSSVVSAAVTRLLHEACPADEVSKRLAALGVLGVYTVADLKLLTEMHLRTIAGFTLGETVSEQRTSQTLRNVMAGTDPANWVALQHSLQSQRRLNAQKNVPSWLLSHTMRCTTCPGTHALRPPHVRAIPASPSLARDLRPWRLLPAISAFGHVPRMSCSRTCVLSATFLPRGSKHETVHAILCAHVSVQNIAHLLFPLLGSENGDSGEQT